MNHVEFAAGLLAIGLASVGIARWTRIEVGWQPLTALLRAALQLSVVALLLRGVLSAPATTAAFVALMLATASWTSGGRLSAVPHGRRIALLGVLAGAGSALALAFAAGLVAFDARHVVALSGIVIGNAMNAATLAGRRFAQNARQQRDEVEGWLALGATPERAYDEIARTAVREALLPNLDQTRATGLVTLPGAFVGALFGGASPIEAAEFQLVVLACVVLSMLVCGLVVARSAARTPYIFVGEDSR
ncbi:ABC transporter permease [Nocardioides sp.]|uniref:ABC transporter permease n=1 Tax=Nocardioides sp. TaxID=35761 RepID=UPI002602D91C|nr:ABC transporter permease [Nocardioides sp.]